MAETQLTIQISPSQPNIPAEKQQEDPLDFLIEIVPNAGPDPGSRAPLSLVLVIDASATMYHFQLTDDERDYWMGLGIARNEVERGEADEHEAVYWTGQTLSEMQGFAVTPMGQAVEAIKNILVMLQSEDRIAVIVFADQPLRLFDSDDWKSDPDRCISKLNALREQRLPVELGTGTHMAGAVQEADSLLRSMRASSGESIARLMIISDGIVQDSAQTLVNMTVLQEQGLSVSTIGVGSEFDEEFLTKIADNSRGNYYYAADSTQIIDDLQREVAALENTAVTDLYLAVRGIDGSVVRDMFLVRPTMNLFDELFTEAGWLRARIGEVSTQASLGILVQIVPAAQPSGSHVVGEVQLTWSGSHAELHGKKNQSAAISLNYTADPTLMAEKDPEIKDLVDRFSIYRFEREAQRAQERGDYQKAREKLGAATRQLRKIGEQELAQDMEQQITLLGGVESDPSMLKRIKATTRRLASSSNGPTGSG